ncbi:hypothetical protein AAY473_014787 [Plecturocebus cupreus]
MPLRPQLRDITASISFNLIIVDHSRRAREQRSPTFGPHEPSCEGNIKVPRWQQVNFGFRRKLHYFLSLFSDQLVKHSPKLFVDFLHLIDVTGHLVHGLDGHWKKTGGEMRGCLETLVDTGLRGGPGPRLTVQVVVLLALGISQGEQLLKQKRVLEDPLDGLDERRAESGWQEEEKQFTAGKTSFEKGKQARCSGSCLSSQHFGRLRWVDHLRLGVRNQPGQHGETPISTKNKKNKKLARRGGSQGQEIKTILANMVKPVSTKNTKNSWAWWHVPVIPATLEAEAGESLEPRRQRLQ